MSELMKLEPKAPSATWLVFTVRVTPLECDENQRMYGGELTKLLDVAGECSAPTFIQLAIFGNGLFPHCLRRRWAV